MKKILGIILLLLFVFSGITVLADEVLTINGEEIKHLGTNDNVYIADEKTYILGLFIPRRFPVLSRCPCQN